MNKKQTLLFIIGMFIVVGIGFTYAGLELARNDFALDLTSRADTQLKKMELENPLITGCIKVNEDYCEFKVWKQVSKMVEKDVYDENETVIDTEMVEVNERYNLGSHKVRLRYCNDWDDGECLSWSAYSDNEIKTKIREKSNNYLEKFADVSIERENEYGDIEVGEGVITTRSR